MPVVPMFTRPCAVAAPRSSGVSSKVANGRLADGVPEHLATPHLIMPERGCVPEGCGSGFAAHDSAASWPPWYDLDCAPCGASTAGGSPPPASPAGAGESPHTPREPETSAPT